MPLFNVFTALFFWFITIQVELKRLWNDAYSLRKISFTKFIELCCMAVSFSLSREIGRGCRTERWLFRAKNEAEVLRGSKQANRDFIPFDIFKISIKMLICLCRFGCARLSGYHTRTLFDFIHLVSVFLSVFYWSNPLTLLPLRSLLSDIYWYWYKYK